MTVMNDDVMMMIIIKMMLLMMMQLLIYSKFNHFEIINQDEMGKIKNATHLEIVC
jgi:hypothetical protein